MILILILVILLMTYNNNHHHKTNTNTSTNSYDAENRGEPIISKLLKLQLSYRIFAWRNECKVAVLLSYWPKRPHDFAQKSKDATTHHAWLLRPCNT